LLHYTPFTPATHAQAKSRPATRAADEGTWPEITKQMRKNTEPLSLGPDLFDLLDILFLIKLPLVINSILSGDSVDRLSVNGDQV